MITFKSFARFYDKDDDGALNFNEFKNMLQSVRKAKKQPIDAASIAQDAHGFYRLIKIRIRIIQLLLIILN